MCKFYKKMFFIFYFFCVLFSLFANPFTQKKSSPTPVQQNAPSENIVKGMRFLSERLAFYIEAWEKHGELKMLFTIFAIAFAFGFVHALAPGHRKVVVFSHFLSREANWHEPAILGFCLAALHALSSLVLMLIFRGISGAVSVLANDASIYMEGITFIVLIVLSLYEIVEALISLFSKQTCEKKSHEKNLKFSGIVLSAIYPCPAAMLIAVFATNLDAFSTGCFAIFALSIGMSLPIIAAGYLAWAGRTAVFSKLRENEKKIKILTSLIQIFAFLLLLILSLKIALPFIVGLFKTLKK